MLRRPLESAGRTTVWDGRLTVTGGRLLLPEYVGPEVLDLDEERLAWRHTTFSFGEPYGAQRGGVEASLVGPDDAEVVLECGPRTLRVGLGELAGRLAADGVLPVPATGTAAGAPGTLVLQTATGALLGLGTGELEVTVTDDAPVPPDGPTFYYARVFQTDGELAWSSPIWVQRAAAEH